MEFDIPPFAVECAAPISHRRGRNRNASGDGRANGIRWKSADHDWVGSPAPFTSSF